jgi:signal transduction histidine kinase
MKSWFRGKRGGLVAFLAISALVAGGLGWATAAALNLEREQIESQRQAEINDKLRLAMWRLDSRVSPLLAREDTRPFNHFKALFAPALAIQRNGYACEAGSILEPSPLVSDELPDWILLHFQADALGHWESPQVLTPVWSKRLEMLAVPAARINVTDKRRRLLEELKDDIQPAKLLACVREHGEQHAITDTTVTIVTNELNINPIAQTAQKQGLDLEYMNRANQQAQLRNTSKVQQAPIPNEEVPQSSSSKDSARPLQAKSLTIAQGSMAPLWVAGKDGAKRLLFARFVKAGDQDLCQGIVLDWPKLQTILATEIQDLFSGMHFTPTEDSVPAHPERTMTALPVELEIDPAAAGASTWRWTPLRAGLAMSWSAALVALLAVALGGWSLIELSERRIRFVSAVTHELRTPLTTLRLYLDMLSGGMVKEESQKEEYLRTLNSEADRLNRLVGNVLDFSRLERQSPRLVKSTIGVAELLEQVYVAWSGRCEAAGKALVLENRAEECCGLLTDVQILQQILGNLIDNACKYSQGASDRRIWLRAVAAERGSLALEVEDRGPGVAAAERRSIFRPFQRGKNTDATGGGVGLGLALAQRWARLLDGRLTVQTGEGGVGACFQLTLPVAAGGC